MKLFKSLLAGLVLGTATLPTLISPAVASSCRLNTGLYQHEDGTQLRLYRIQGGGYQLKVGQHGYVVNGTCDGSTFSGLRTRADFDDRPFVPLKLEKVGSKYRYYEIGKYDRGAWYQYR